MESDPNVRVSAKASRVTTDPAALISLHVSSQAPAFSALMRRRSDTASALCALESGHPLSDETGEEAPDVLVLADPSLGTRAANACLGFSRSTLHSLYLSIALTRSLSLPLPQQHAALLMASFAKAGEQALRRRGGGMLTEKRITREVTPDTLLAKA